MPLQMYQKILFILSWQTNDLTYTFFYANGYIKSTHMGQMRACNLKKWVNTALAKCDITSRTIVDQ